MAYLASHRTCSDHHLMPREPIFSCQLRLQRLYLGHGGCEQTKKKTNYWLFPGQPLSSKRSTPGLEQLVPPLTRLHHCSLSSSPSRVTYLFSSGLYCFHFSVTPGPHSTKIYLLCIFAPLGVLDLREMEVLHLAERQRGQTSSGRP